MSLLKIASVLQYTAYGIPSLYYGDELGMEGYGDPFCRMPMPWHEIDEPIRAEILAHYRALGRIRLEEDALCGGAFYVVERGESHLVFVREKGESRLIVVANRGQERQFDVPEGVCYRDLISGVDYIGSVTIPEDSAMILKEIVVEA